MDPPSHNSSTPKSDDHESKRSDSPTGSSPSNLAVTTTKDDNLLLQDPLLWPSSKKRIVLGCCTSFYFLFTFLTTVTVPTFSPLQVAYDVDYTRINYTVAIPALALAVSPLFWTPLADIYGRRTVMIVACLVAFVASIGSALANNYAGYMAARFMQGWGAGPASTVGLAMLQDIYSELERGEKVGYWTLAIDLGLLFGPLIGGFAALVSYTFPAWLTAILFGVLLLVMFLFLPETAFPREAAVSQNGFTLKQNPFLNVKPITGLKHPKLWSTTASCIKLHAYPVLAIPTICYCWSWYWFILCPITMIPAAYPNYSAQIQGLLFVGLIIGTMTAEAFFAGRLSDRLVTRLSRRTDGVRVPEHRLWLFYPAAVSTAVGLVLFGCTVQFEWHWAVGQVALALTGLGVQIGNTTTVAYVVDCYPHLVMEVTAFYSLHLNLSAFASPFFTVPWVERNGWVLSFGLQGLIVFVAASLFVPFLQLRGGRLRSPKGP